MNKSFSSVFPPQEGSQCGAGVPPVVATGVGMRGVDTDKLSYLCPPPSIPPKRGEDKEVILFVVHLWLISTHLIIAIILIHMAA